MCGRVRFPSRQDIISHFNITKLGATMPAEDAAVIRNAPAPSVPVIVKLPADRLLAGMRWGFKRESTSVYNARSETIASLPMWKESYKSYRCIFPVQAFFESVWFSSDRIIGAAGIYRPVVTGTGNSVSIHFEAAMITKEANKVVSPYHTRMPVFVAPSRIDPWLDGLAGINEVHDDPDLYVPQVQLV